jgi:soluble lytic murein transglycosylase-like protein
LFKLGGLESLKKNYKKSNEYFSRYISEGTGKIDWDTDAAMFFKAMNFKELGSVSDYSDTLQELVRTTPYSFYSCLAREELGISFVEELSSLQTKADVQGRIIAPNELFTLHTAIWLVRAGLVEEAATELSYINPFNLSPKYTEIIAEVYNKSASPNGGIAIASKLLSVYGKYISREHMLSHYPLLYMGLINSIAKKTGVHPYIPLAIMRRESAFNSSIVSPKGATGLMQIMPGTAEILDKNPNKGALTDPGENIRLGSIYLRNLAAQYKGNLIYMLADYNAGSQALKRWIRWYEKRNNPILFIESIPYKETREYVKAIVKNLYFYNAIYNKKDAKFGDIINVGGGNG